MVEIEIPLYNSICSENLECRDRFRDNSLLDTGRIIEFHIIDLEAYPLLNKLDLSNSPLNEYKLPLHLFFVTIVTRPTFILRDLQIKKNVKFRENEKMKNNI